MGLLRPTPRRCYSHRRFLFQAYRQANENPWTAVQFCTWPEDRRTIVGRSEPCSSHTYVRRTPHRACMHCFPQCIRPIHSAHKKEPPPYTSSVAETQLGCTSSVRRQRKRLSRAATSDRIAASQGQDVLNRFRRRNTMHDRTQPPVNLLTGFRMHDRITMPLSSFVPAVRVITPE